MSILITDTDPTKTTGYERSKDPYFDANHLVVKDIIDYAVKNDCVIVTDFDGVVFDTEMFQMKAFGDIARNNCPFTMSNEQMAALEFENLAARMVGLPERKILGILKDEYALPQSLDHLVDMRGEQYLSSLLNSGLQPNACTMALYEYANRYMDKKPVIVSNGRYAVQSTILNYHNCAENFHAIKTCDVVMPDLPLDKRKKAYIAHMFDKFAGKVIVLEDSPSMSRFVQEELNGKTGYVRHECNRDNSFRPETGWTMYGPTMKYRYPTPKN